MPPNVRFAALVDAFPSEFARVLDWIEDYPVLSDKLVAPHDLNASARVDVAFAMMRHSACLRVDCVRPKIGGVADQRGPRFVRCRLRARVFRPVAVGHDLYGHVAAPVINNE